MAGAPWGGPCLPARARGERVAWPAGYALCAASDSPAHEQDPRPHRHRRFRDPACLRQLRRRDPPGDRATNRAPGVESFYFLAGPRADQGERPGARAAQRWRSPPRGWPAGWNRTRLVLPPVRHPEIPELTWLLTCVAGRACSTAHAYKAAVDKNRAGARRRCGDQRGPVHVPGADGRRHPGRSTPTGCRWAATRCSTSRWRATLAQRSITSTATISRCPRRRSRSRWRPARPRRPQDEQELRQHHPAVRAAELKKLIAGIVTDSRARRRRHRGSALFQLYQAFASRDKTAAFAGPCRQHRLGAI